MATAREDSRDLTGGEDTEKYKRAPGLASHWSKKNKQQQNQKEKNSKKEFFLSPQAHALRDFS